uniref:Phosphopantetheine attachment site protein n=1 Tax=Simulacricoccus ruber TaxID=2303410 RepID=A0A3S7UVJ8_9BACT|nr:phosphopantetheine attachment site protein [Simulacricoccus ruber]
MVELVADPYTDTEAAVLEEIRRIAAEELEWTRPVQPADDLLRDLQLDSLGLTVLAVGLENRFRVRLTEEDSAGVLTVRDLMRLVAMRTAESAGESAS